MISPLEITARHIALQAICLLFCYCTDRRDLLKDIFICFRNSSGRKCNWTV